MLSVRIMEMCSSESPRKRSKSQQASFERLLEDDFSAYVQEDRRNSTSIISDPAGTVWKVRCNDLGVEEIREEGERNLGGKKLSDEECFDDHDEQQEVRSLGSSLSDGQDSSFLYSSSCLSDDKKVDLEEEEMKNGHFGASLTDVDHCLCDGKFEEKMGLVEEKKSGHFAADLEEENGCDEKIKRKMDLVDGKKKKSEHFDANVEMKSGHLVANLGEKNGCDEKIQKKKDLVDGKKKKKSEHFDANLEKKGSGKCRVSKGFAMVTMSIIVGMIILMSFDFGNFGKDEVFLVPT